MKLRLHDKIIYRVPQFPVDATLEECWDELKKSIALASTDFYRHIKDIEYSGYQELSPQIKLTLQKYFNRTRFRATPYGTFAGCGMAGIGRSEESNGSITIANEPVLHEFHDWSQTQNAGIDWKTFPAGEITLFANSSHYTVADFIRYLYKGESGFELSDIPAHSRIEKILHACKQPVGLAAITELLGENIGSPEMAKDMIGEMTDAQLLFTNLHPNIIGGDYFGRIAADIRQGTRSYIITERTCINGSLDPKVLSPLKNLIPLLHESLPPSEAPDSLQKFIRDFQKKYDQGEIPIMQALDPEIGIGYGNMERQEAEGLVSEIEDHKLSLANSTGHGALRETLLARLARNATGSVIDLIDLALPRRDAKLPLPNTFSALLHVADGMVQLEHLGGCTATALLGRFTLMGGDMLHHGRELARIEMQANPEVLFFDVGYLGETNVDNINRRENIYGWQLAILNYDTTQSPLTLDDMLLSVRGGELVITSRKHNKRLIPRVAAAYNYHRSDLPLFRLLCDLQHQGLQTNLMLDLQGMVPGLGHYPRVQFHNVILSPAKWLLDYNSISGNKPAGAEVFVQYLDGLRLPSYIKVGYADQTLLMEPASAGDRDLLLSILRAKGSLWVQEALAPRKLPVQDRDGKKYVGEFLVSFVHGTRLYRAYTPLPLHGNVERVFVPGSEWLYYQLYCHPANADELLTGEIRSVLEAHATVIKKWFYIRYREDGNHIRFRLCLHGPDDIAEIMKGVSAALDARLRNGLLSDLRLSTYHRELERYGAERIEDVERHFHHDSRFALHVLAERLSTWQKYSVCIDLMVTVGQSTFSNGRQFPVLVGRACKNHNDEHLMTGAAFKKLNRAFERYVAIQAHQSSPALEKPKQILIHSFMDILGHCGPERKEQLFTDLFHMHINRLFADDQRVHELIIYNFLAREINRTFYGSRVRA